MKLLVIASVVATAGLAGNALADCTSGTQLPDLNVLVGKTVCVGTGSNREAQEYHSGGRVIEWALGTDIRDKTHDVGEYVIANPQITYKYSGGQQYTYTVHNVGSNYYFCDLSSALKATATLMNGQGPCP